MERVIPLNEKRRYKRAVLTGVKVSYDVMDPRTWSSYLEKAQVPIENISMGGLSINAAQQLAVQTPLGIDISITPHQETIKVFGKVAWIKQRENKNNYDMGISFSWWKRDEDKKTLYELIRKNNP